MVYSVTEVVLAESACGVNYVILITNCTLNSGKFSVIFKQTFVLHVLFEEQRS